MTTFFISYIIGCIIVSLIGYMRKVKYIDLFFLSFWLTPIFGFIMLLTNNVQKNDGTGFDTK